MSTTARIVTLAIAVRNRFVYELVAIVSTPLSSIPSWPSMVRGRHGSASTCMNSCVRMRLVSAEATLMEIATHEHIPRQRFTCCSRAQNAHKHKGIYWLFSPWGYDQAWTDLDPMLSTDPGSRQKCSRGTHSIGSCLCTWLS